MKLLGIDTSAIVCSAALISEDSVLSSHTLSDGLTHSETLLPLIKTVLEEGKTLVSELDGIAISHGPGSFTGLRIGISTVKGLAITDRIPCIPVSTLEALAMNAVDQEGAVVCAVMDARRGEFYNSIFRVQDRKLIRLSDDRAIHGSKIAEELSDLDHMIILGDGAEKFVAQNPSFSDRLASVDLRYQSGKSVAELGLRMLLSGQTFTCEELSPRYLRLPQAEREWKEKNK